MTNLRRLPAGAVEAASSRTAVEMVPIQAIFMNPYMETKVEATGARMPALAKVAQWVSYRLNDLCFWADHDMKPHAPKPLLWHLCDWLRGRLNRYWVPRHLRSLPPDMFGRIYLGHQ